MQTIYLDISNKGAIPTIHTKQGDVGRKFLAVITDSGVPHHLDPDNLFSVWYDGDSGEGNYSEIDGRSAFSVNGNKIVVELVTQMLANPGNGVLSLVINDPTGQQIGLWNINYVVEAVPGMDSPEADQYYTAFLNAVKEMAMVGVESPSFPGCYYRVVNGETEWLNPPMEIGEEYRTAERYMGRAVYNALIDCGVPHNGATVDFPFSYTNMVKSSGVLGNSVVLPYTTTGNITEDWQGIGLSIQNGTITINCGGGREGYGNVYCQIWYTKD